jgi:hypothetical protein
LMSRHPASELAHPSRAKTCREQVQQQACAKGRFMYPAKNVVGSLTTIQRKGIAAST